MATGDENNKSDDMLGGVKSSLDGFLQKVGDAIKSNFDIKAIATVVKEVDDAAVGIAKSFGQGRENLLGIKQAMTDAVIGVTKLGGGFEDIARMQKGVAETLGRNVVLVSESYEKLYAAEQVSGIGAERMVGSFKDAGISAYQAAGEMEKVVNVARASGVNAQAVSEKVVSNMDALNKYNFQGGVQGLAKMAAQATSLRIDMKASLDFAEKVFNPEGAIEMAAAMQRLGVANSELLDPLRLMDLSQNDPAELQNQISKMSEQFVQLNKDGQFEIMPGAKRQMRELESAMGLPSGQLAKMALASAETAEKMRQIKFPEGAFSEEQKNLIASMAEMGPGGEFKLSLGGESLGLDEAISKLQSDPAMLKALEESAQPKTMEQLAEDQLTVTQQMAADIRSLVKTPYAIAGTRVAQQATEAPRVATRVIRDVADVPSLSTKNIREGFGGSAEEILGSINKLISGEGSAEQVMNSLISTAEKAKDFGKQVFEEGSMAFKKANEDLANSTNEFIKLMYGASKVVAKAANESENLNIPVKDSLVTINPLPEDSFLTMTKGKEFMESMGSAVMKGSQNSDTSTNNAGGTATINLVITAPAGIDTAQLELAMKNAGVQQAIVDASVKGLYGRNVPTTNPQQLMEMARSR